mmetsp:Transcript_18741/g.33985  ORF Transcript_18741/g.33985 Transcript_18741/m.33985 type:complete len:202 (-) Transcript_18741:454-1059(-)
MGFVQQNVKHIPRRIETSALIRSVSSELIQPTQTSSSPFGFPERLSDISAIGIGHGLPTPAALHDSSDDIEVPIHQLQVLRAQDYGLSASLVLINVLQHEVVEGLVDVEVHDPFLQSLPCLNQVLSLDLRQLCELDQSLLYNPKAIDFMFLQGVDDRFDLSRVVSQELVHAVDRLVVSLLSFQRCSLSSRSFVGRSSDLAD